ncbi:DHA2 family efflux MFS transporter permease subunit [Microbacteriaceae bacterium VKM Ac-2854]|nr:DHA2 family efflux MFS transporter permease subunit [Microbacteriaceae bacterium VKM Ac-2854]
MTSIASVPSARPWPALWALSVGFCLILVDSTVVYVATPAIMANLDADLTAVIWVTSGYLLAYAVPLLVAARLGDRFGQRGLYVGGLAVFTIASAGCGWADTIGMLVLARVVQGLGAALMAPQTVGIITRIFPLERRGAALGVWGATAGVATLVGPILGGILVDAVGWRWIFFVNVPIGVVGIVLAARWVPAVSRRPHRLDPLGVALSAVGLFCVVFGVQEGPRYDWGVIEAGPFTVWSVVAVGVIFLLGFVLWQIVNGSEPLLPLALFGDRNFAFANVAIITIGFAATATALPLMLYLQNGRDLSPTASALLLAPMAVIAAALSPVVGRLTSRVDPKWLAACGVLCFAAGIGWLSAILPARGPIWQLEPPIALLGVAIAFAGSPLSVSATRNLPPRLVGVGAVVVDTLRPIGAVLGAAAIAAVMQSRLVAELGASGAASHGPVPAVAAAGFSAAMGQSLVLPAVVLASGLLAVLALASARPPVVDRPPAPRPAPPLPSAYPPPPSSPSPAPGPPVPPADPPRWNPPSGRRAAR